MCKLQSLVVLLIQKYNIFVLGNEQRQVTQPAISYAQNTHTY
ncbi:Hypothetical protein Cp1002B_0613 [Corynebacterium pseudotuberculosis]|nr:Hypothetical protein CpPAT10_0583 [Corynebacterium pseudotuberculosis PAT10]AEP69842.1 Hypothetical protein Cp4202_0577 [Corynebacterium pseudotuberculosis 42/02-A]AER68653.1 Hypothetical protein Cp106_0565 [Corynebacterium pseudotuberculosis 1/06-A]AFF21738.1 Hypothetical protein CpP54B96_0592 [Corynebacterium pseudotuberculosis P54B96]AFH51512.1 Hypothetical protein Cp267_0608 [Corynebacterium pseudotuberculosis 267]AJC13320.1 Hypothetical protein CpVD57_0597 [Corynebacterium pseudotuberc